MGSFRERKFNEATSKAQFNKTIYFSSTPLYNSAIIETIIASIWILPKTISGQGESIKFSFLGSLAANADLKTIELRLQGQVLLNVILTWDTVTANNTYAIQGEVFSSSTTNNSQMSIVRMSAIGHGFPVLDSIATTSVSLNSGSTLVLAGTSLTANNISCNVVKVDISTAPP